MIKHFEKKFEEMINLESFLLAWQEFIKGKRSRYDVQKFSLNFMDNIILLQRDLMNHTYKHGGYQAFNISDPKPRNIHKASVRDRLTHHAIYRELYPFFDKLFISDSYSCRLGKGAHKAINRFQKFGRQVSKNNTITCWVLKCDIKKFFASIDHKVLKSILAKYIEDKDILWLWGEVIDSFETAGRPNIGLPLGNLTSQLLVNIYMNEFDQFMKRQLKIKHYIRYADDFVIMSRDRIFLEELIPKIRDYLANELKLMLHPDKVFIQTLASGVDYLGWVNFPTHRVLRTATKKRMLKALRNNPSSETLASYLGLLKYGNTKKLKNKIQDIVVFETVL